MIGGTDIALKGHIPREVLMESFRATWPNLVCEPGLFIYRDAAVKKVWDEWGAIPDVYDLMIHVLWSPKNCAEKYTSFVVSDPGSESHRMVMALGAKVAGLPHPHHALKLPVP